jgi:hypothetical protein
MSTAIADPASWPVEVQRANHALEEELTDRARLEAIGAALADVARETGATMVTGASPLGHQLAGYVASHNDAGVVLWAQNGARGTVLVIEGVLVSGAQMISTARRAGAAGADRVVGAAVVAAGDGLALCRSEIGRDVHALRELALAV